MHVALIALLALVPGMPAFQLGGMSGRRDKRALGIAFISPGNLTTCTPATLTWLYASAYVAPTQLLNIGITNFNVPQFAPVTSTTPTATDTGTDTDSTTDTYSTTGTSSSTTGLSSVSDPGLFPSPTVPLPQPPNEPVVTPPSPVARDLNTPITLTIASSIPVCNLTTGAREYVWPAVDVPPGWYVINGSSPDFDVGVILANSLRFYVSDSGDTSCIPQPPPPSPVPSASDVSGSSPTTIPSSSSRLSSGAIVGAVIGGIVLLAAVIGVVAFWLISPRTSRRRAAGSTGWGQVHSTDTRGGTPGARFGAGSGAAAAGVSAHTLPEDDNDSLASEKIAPTSAVMVRRSSGASAASLYKPARLRTSAPITPEAEGYALGVLGRAAVTPSPTVPPLATSKKTPRKAVPTYDPREMAGATIRTETEDDESTAVGSHGSAGLLRKVKHTSDDAYPFVLNANGSSGQIHYLVPDPLPLTAR